MVSLSSVRARLRAVYYGWWILLSAVVLGTFSSALFVLGATLFFGPVRKDLGLSSAQTSLIFSLSRAQGGIAVPIVGPLVDRFGVGPFIISGGILASLGFIVLHWVDSYWAFLLVFVAVISLGRSAGLTLAPITAVNRWFYRRNSIAMSMAVISFISGGAMLLPLVNLGVHTVGWRDTMLYSGMFMVVIVTAAGAVMRQTPESMGLQLEGMEQTQARPAPGEGVAGSRAPAADFSAKEALRTKSYWLLAAANVLRVTVRSAILIHAVELMVWEGIGRETAGVMFSLMVLFSIPLGLGAGVLGARYRLQPLLSAGSLAGVMALICLLLLEGNLAIYMFVALAAIDLGADPLAWVAIGSFFGRRRFATLLGIMSGPANIGMLVSPYYAGWISDTHGGSYELALLTFAPIYGLCAILYLITPTPAPPHRTA